MYETAVLYVKLEEFEATLNYLNDLLDTYVILHQQIMLD